MTGRSALVRWVHLGLLIPALLILTLSGCSVPRSHGSLKGVKFEPFTVKGGHFKVSMPGKPEDKSTSSPMGTSSKRYCCEDSEIAFVVSEDTFPAHIAAALKNGTPTVVQSGLDGACSNCMKELKASETQRAAVALGGGMYPGRSIEGTISEPVKGKVRYRFYVDCANGRMYTVGVAGIKSRTDQPEVDTFLSSLVIF